jgi:hypothetical protein
MCSACFSAIVFYEVFGEMAFMLMWMRGKEKKNVSEDNSDADEKV